MKDIINKTILEWIGRKKQYDTPNKTINQISHAEIDGYNQALQDLRNKAPQLAQEIVDMVVEEIYQKSRSKKDLIKTFGERNINKILKK